MHGTNSSSTQIGVLIVDDSPDITTMIGRLLSTESDLRVVGVLHEASALSQEIARLRPKVVLLDLTMPGVPPLEALRRAAGACAEAGTRVLAFSGHDDDETATAAKQAGAWDLLSKGEDPTAIVSAVRAAAR